MASAPLDAQARSADHQYRALLAVSEAIVSHRDLAALFHELAGRLQQVVRFDYLALLLHEAATNTLRLHVLEPPEPRLLSSVVSIPVGEAPVGLVWQTPQPLILPNVAADTRWPAFAERMQRYGMQSFCHLALTTARRRLGALTFASKQPSAYNAADLGFLQLVANQAAVAVENALAFQEIAALKDQLAKEKAYLEEEVRTEHHFGEIVGESAALRRQPDPYAPMPQPQRQPVQPLHRQCQLGAEGPLVRRRRLRHVLAADVYAHRLRQTIGGFTATLGGVDALVFTAGVAEHDAAMRAAACHGLECLGLELDAAANAGCKPNADVASPASLGRILVIATREDLTIVRETVRVLREGG